MAIAIDRDGDGADDVVEADAAGLVRIDIDGPIIAVVSSPGTLDEPVAVDPTDRRVEVRLWDRMSADGVERQSMHFGGDVMMGRRYLDEQSATTPVVDAATARAVVDDLAPLSAAADWTVVNLETVVGELDDDGALAAKRFLLQSTPYVTDALDEMGVDLVTLGNNHAYDWGDDGIETTLTTLDAQGLAHVGAGQSDADALRGRIDEVGGLSIGTISLTTVNGSFVNDQLPGTDDARPDDLPATEAWQYELREFGFDTGDANTSIAVEERRIGAAWTLFESIEPELDATTVERLWADLTAVYPELQDWVARRGHGGAAQYDRVAVEAEIQRLRNDGAEFVVVQVHGGFQFAETASTFMTTVAHRAVDAGADMVIAHHPHVLQGVEWYDGKLIAYSLGNLVFDQDFLGTFPTMLLRVITEGDAVVEARVLPVILDRYRPVPLTGPAAHAVVEMVNARGALAARSERIDGLDVGNVLGSDAGPVTTGAAVRFDRNSGVVTDRRVVEPIEVTLDAEGIGRLPACSLVPTDALPVGVQAGVDVFGWGRFDDGTADDRTLLPLNWQVPVVRDNWAKVPGSSGAAFDEALEIRTDPNESTGAQIAARLDVPRHRIFDASGAPLDGVAEYEIRLDVRRVRGETPVLRMISFAFDDTNPTADPETTRVAEVALGVETPGDDVWRPLSIDVPDELFGDRSDDVEPNTALLVLDVPAALRGVLAVDNVEVIEWRGATAGSEPVWQPVDYVRGQPGRTVQLSTSRC